MPDSDKTPLEKLMGGEPTGIEEPEGGLMALTPDEPAPLTCPPDGQGLTGDPDEIEGLSARVSELEARVLYWVDLGQRAPTEPGTYCVMSRVLSSPRLLKLDGPPGRHWDWVTHWYGPLPVCECPHG